MVEPLQRALAPMIANERIYADGPLKKSTDEYNRVNLQSYDIHCQSHGNSNGFDEDRLQSELFSRLRFLVAESAMYLVCAR